MLKFKFPCNLYVGVFKLFHVCFIIISFNKLDNILVRKVPKQVFDLLKLFYCSAFNLPY